MAEILIENYRGYEIHFNPEHEQFRCSIDNGVKWHQKQSFSAAKNFIDEHIKANATFEPFFVVKGGNMFSEKKKVKIVSIRKDGRFVYEGDKGKKEQISDYNEKDWILDLPENDKHFAIIATYELEIDQIRQKIKEEESKIKAPTLEELKEKYLPK